MISRLLFVVLVAVSAAASASCGVGGPDDDLVAALPKVVPSTPEVSEEIGATWELELVPGSSGVWSNADVAEAEETTVDVVQDSGRIDGYQVFYTGGPHPNYPLLTVGLALSLYRDERSASAFFQSGPDWTGGAPVQRYEFADEGQAWPMTSVNDQPMCPCQIWLRVGRLVATVDVGHGGPSSASTLPAEDGVALARLIAERMRSSAEP